MRIRSIIHFSWKNLWAHRMRTTLTVGGVSIGVSAIVFLVSLGFGLEQLVTSQVANFEAFTIIDIPSANLKSGKINQQALDRLSEIPHITSIERVVDLAGRAKLGSQKSTTETVVIGVNPKYFDLADVTLSSGSFFKPEVTDEAVVNTSLAGLLGFSENPIEVVGASIILDVILAEDLRKSDDVDGPLIKEGITVKVVGLTPDNENPAMFLPLKLAEELGVENYTSIKLQVDSREAVPEARKQIENVGFFTEYVGDTVGQITQVFSVFRLVLGGFGTIALIVAALGTFNTLTISLIERIREVALLKMLGMKRYDVFKLFITESLSIGILGGLLGSGIGYGIGTAGNELVRQLAARSGADPVAIFYTPVNFIVIITVGSIVVGFLTGLYPSYRAIRTNPLDALRYE